MTTISKIIEWLLAILFIIVIAFLIWWLPFFFAEHSNKPELPYTRPHIEVSQPNGDKCAAWMLPHNGVYVLLCENEPPVLIPIHEFRSEMNL